MRNITLTTGATETVSAAAADAANPAAAAVAPISASAGYATLDSILGAIRELPPSMRGEAAEGGAWACQTVPATSSNAFRIIIC